jgi:Protein of unknown function (DUF3105)
MRALLVICGTAALAGLAACGGGGESTTADTTVASRPCSPVEEPDVLNFGEHSDQQFTGADYDTNPPSGGDHNPTPLEAGQFYTDPPPVGQAVHLLEHGAVIGWTNDLSPEDQKAVEREFNDVFKDGYYQLATVENPEMGVPFAPSAWEALQKCTEVDTSVIRPFVEEWYASPKSGESFQACDGPARRLPPC